MIYQKPTKTITAAYTTTDDDNGYRIICNSASDFTVTLHTATGKYNFDLEVDNIGAGEITIGSQVLSQYTHAHIGNNGGTDWAVVVGGGNFSLNDLTGDVVLAEGDNITLETVGNTITINSTGGGSFTLNGISTAATLAAGTNVTLTTVGDTITISATGTGGGGAYYEPLCSDGEILFSPNGDILMGEVT